MTPRLRHFEVEKMSFWLIAGFLLAGYYVGRKHEQWVRDNPSRKKWGMTLLSLLIVGAVLLERYLL